MGGYGEFAEVVRLVEQGLPVHVDGEFDLSDYPSALTRLAEHAENLAHAHHRFRDGRNTERLYEQLTTRMKGQA